MKQTITLLLLLIFIGGGKLWADDTTLASVTFDGCNGTGGNDTEGFAHFETGTKVNSNLATYCGSAVESVDNKMLVANGCIYNYGSAKVIALKAISQSAFTNGKGTLTFKVATASDKDSANFKVNITNATYSETGKSSKKDSNDYNVSAKPAKGSWTTYTVNITEVTGDVTIQLKGSTCYIDDIKVTTETAADPAYAIPIADLRFTHLYYNPSRENIAGFNITTSGWQTATDNSVTPNRYVIHVNNDSKTNNTITITPNSANSSVKIKQVVLVAKEGTTFSGFTPSTDDTGATTSITSGNDQVVWQHESGLSSATIKLNVTGDIPNVEAIYIFTDKYTTWAKQDVSIAFSPNSESVEPSSGEKNVAPTTTPEKFRVDYEYDAGATGAVGTYHLSTEKYGITPGSALGTATLTASFGGNAFYNSVATDAVYTLNIVNNDEQTKTIRVSDMKYNPTLYSLAGLSASNGLDRTLGGFQFAYTGGQGVKSNGKDGLIFRTSGSDVGTLVITPQKSGTGTITITKVVLTTAKVAATQSLKGNGTTVEVAANQTTVTFDDLTAETFTLEGNTETGVYVEAFEIHYTDPNGVLQVTKVRPTIAFSKTSDTVVKGGSYTSPTVTTSPANFDVKINNSNSDLVILEETDWNNGKLASLKENETGTATLTAFYTAGEDDLFASASSDPYTVTVVDEAPATVTFSPAEGAVTRGTKVTLSTTTDGATIYYTTDGSTPTTASTPYTHAVTVNNKLTIKAIAVKDGIASDVASATYTISSGGTLWDFTTLDVEKTIDANWEANKSGDYYGNTFTTSTAGTDADYAAGENSQLYRLVFGRKGDVVKAASYRIYPEKGDKSGYITYNHSNLKIGVPVTAGQTVLVTFAGDGSKAVAYDFSNATLTDGKSAADANETVTMELTATADGYVDLYNSTGKPHLFSIEVYTDERTTFGLRSMGGQTATYDNTSTTTFYHTVITIDSGNNATAYLETSDNSNIELVSSNPSVIDVSAATIEVHSANKFQVVLHNIKVGSAGTAYITVNFTGNGSYKPSTGTTQLFTVTGKTGYGVIIDDQQVQRGQQSYLEPYITNAAGQKIGIRNDGGTYSLYVVGDGDDEEETNYSDYFDFSYAALDEGTGTNYEQIAVNATTGAITTRDGSTYAEVGATRKLQVTATPKASVSGLFSNETSTHTSTITIIDAAAAIELDFFWDAAMTIPVTGPGSDKDYKVSGSTGVFGESGTFASGFPNGRMMYVRAKSDADNIWFSISKTKNSDASNIKSNPKLDRTNYIYKYQRGIPIHLDEALSRGDYICVNVVATTPNPENAKEEPLHGGVAKMKFYLVDHSRPDAPTYDPVSPDEDTSKNEGTDYQDGKGRKIMTTAENVVAYGEGASKGVAGNGNLVYGKFSTSSVYTTSQLINEATVTSGIDNAPVISTEVNNRRFTTVQIRVEGPGQEYVSYQSKTEFFYLFDTTMKLTLDANNRIEKNATYTAPTYTVTWVNKGNKGLDSADPEYKGDPVNQEVDYYAKNDKNKVTFAITQRNGAGDATVNAATGAVTAGTEPGWVKVTATYNGTIEKEYHGKDNINIDNAEKNGGVRVGEPQYKSYTASTTAEYFVYVKSDKGEPVITPTTRNFPNTLEYRIDAPKDWDVRYTIDGTDPTPTSGTLLSKNKTVYGVTGETVTVKAIAYDPTKTSWTADDKSRIVQETYTKVDPLPDPVFNPDGVPTPYVYNTNTLTVQIACAYAGSEIYYTVDGKTDPVRGAEGTYKYSGLSKVIISGNVSIRAIAWDPVRDIYSNVVISNYLYSTDMERPYFQVSDNGTDWYGFNAGGNWVKETDEEKAAYWMNGQSHKITPATQIRLKDPNAVSGTIYFTLDGSMPQPETALIYQDSPFTLAKSTTGKALVMLDEASSGMSSAVFVIPAALSHVWEAVQSTTPNGVMAPEERVITTNEDASILNTRTGINRGSIENAEDVVYAQPYITATFGGFADDDDNAEWSYMNLLEDSKGIPIDGVGEFTIKGKNNAQDELKSNYNHVYTMDSYQTGTGESKKTITLTPHEKTFKLPARGTFVRFEPERDGDLTIWALQQGSLNYHEDEVLCKTFIRCRPVYLVDEQGHSIPVKQVNGKDQMWSSARLSANWAAIQETAANNRWPGYTDGKDGHQNESGYGETITYRGEETFVANKGYNIEESKALYDLYNSYLTTNGIKVGYPIKPIAIHTAGRAENPLSHTNGKFIDNSEDGTGYVMLTGGFVKYTFPVKAGKTYYFFGQGTKIGIRGFQFLPAETDSEVDSRELVTINADGTAGVGDTDYYTAMQNTKKPLNVTLKRAFKADTWTPLVLPFSVSETQLEAAFSTAGTRVDVIHFDDITKGGRNIHMVRHWYKMIVAGTPVLIRPTKDIAADTGVTFKGVRMETTTPETLTGTDDSYSMIGTFTWQAFSPENERSLHQYDYYINTNGNYSRYIGTGAAMKATRAWLRPKNAEAAKELTVEFTDYDDEDNVVTGITEIDFGDGGGSHGAAADSRVYTVSGQLVRTDGDLTRLPKGVYVVNGNRYVVK